MDGKIGEIILPGFGHPYNIGNLMVFFQQVQQLRNSLEREESAQYQELNDLFKTIPIIDNVQYLCTAQELFEQAGARAHDDSLDIKTILTDILSKALPQEGHIIACPFNEGGAHWCFMTIFNNGHEIFYSYNDPAGTPMKSILREAIESDIIQNAAAGLGKTTRIIDNQKAININCVNPCGIGAIISGYILAKNPLNPKLDFEGINELQSHFYRIFHVMMDGTLWPHHQTLEEKIMLLHIIDQIHSQNPGSDLLIGAAQSLFKYLEPNTQLDSPTLSQLKSTLDYKFATSDWTPNAYGADFLEGFQAAKESTRILSPKNNIDNPQNKKNTVEIKILSKGSDVYIINDEIYSVQQESEKDGTKTVTLAGGKTVIIVDGQPTVPENPELKVVQKTITDTTYIVGGKSYLEHSKITNDDGSELVNLGYLSIYLDPTGIPHVLGDDVGGSDGNESL